jgi:hypothetical protein
MHLTLTVSCSCYTLMFEHVCMKFKFRRTYIYNDRRWNTGLIVVVWYFWPPIGTTELQLSWVQRTAIQRNGVWLWCAQFYSNWMHVQYWPGLQVAIKETSASSHHIVNMYTIVVNWNQFFLSVNVVFVCGEEAQIHIAKLGTNVKACHVQEKYLIRLVQLQTFDSKLCN